MNKTLMAVALIFIIIGAVFFVGAALGRWTVGCTGSPYLSIVLTGRVTDSATGLGINGAGLSWVDPPYSTTSIGGTLADSNGYYYKFTTGSGYGQYIDGCDTIQVTVTKTGSTYSTYTTTFQLPDNVCSPTTSPCGSYTYGANYALTQAGSNPLTASFTYVVSSLTASFTDRTTGMPTGWNWNFGDGYTSIQQNPSHTYSSGGNYQVTLTAYRSTDGVSSTASSLITVVYGGTNQGTSPPPSCPAGYTGTYPNCTPPAYNPNQNPNQNQTNNSKAVVPKPPLTTAQLIGIGAMAVGFVILVVAGLMPGITFMGIYVHPAGRVRRR